MNRIIDFYVDQFLWDMSVMSSPWMYIPLLIPIMFFLPFFFMKWTVLTIPLWLPFAIIRAIFTKTK